VEKLYNQTTIKFIDKNILEGPPSRFVNKIARKILKVPNNSCFPNLTCLSNQEPWFNIAKVRLQLAPLDPAVITGGIIFKKRNLKMKEYRVYPVCSQQLDKDFDPKLPTFVITHGFMDDAFNGYTLNLTDSILRKVDANVILADWKDGAKSVSGFYFKAISNLRVVPLVLEFLFRHLENLGADLSTFHLIGHSLGAHLLGYVCKLLPGKIGRLTGLDPAAPMFDLEPKAVRLERGYAQFTDLIHTNAGFLVGSFFDYGDVDFYVNGGLFQPTCSVGKVGCSHELSWRFFISAIDNPNCFMGRRMNKKLFYKAVGNVVAPLRVATPFLVRVNTPCSLTECLPMGLNTRESPLRGSFVLTTKVKYPYCIY